MPRGRWRFWKENNTWDEAIYVHVVISLKRGMPKMEEKLDKFTAITDPCGARPPSIGVGGLYALLISGKPYRSVEKITYDIVLVERTEAMMIYEYADALASEYPESFGNALDVALSELTKHGHIVGCPRCLSSECICFKGPVS